MLKSNESRGNSEALTARRSPRPRWCCRWCSCFCWASSGLDEPSTSTPPSSRRRSRERSPRRASSCATCGNAPKRVTTVDNTIAAVMQASNLDPSPDPTAADLQIVPPDTLYPCPHHRPPARLLNRAIDSNIYVCQNVQLNPRRRTQPTQCGTAGQLSISISVLSAFHFAQHADRLFCRRKRRAGWRTRWLASDSASPRKARLLAKREKWNTPPVSLLRDEQGSALLEFAITLPLLVVFVVGIYDFSGAFNQKQKIEQAAQEGAIIAGAQPMSDIQRAANGPRAPFSATGGDRSFQLAGQQRSRCQVEPCTPPRRGIRTGGLA